MKIEKINENQIRCTLTRADLAERKLKLSELTYGSEKARNLFQDMMRQAAYELGFEADDIPLMIEAIPSSSDSIVLIITKVEDPDELDTRFSRFSPSPQGENADRRRASMLERLRKLEGADEFMDILRHMKDDSAKTAGTETVVPEEEEKKPDTEETPSVRFFSFATLDSAIRACHFLLPMYHGSNSLYKDTAENIYILVLTRAKHTAADFVRICNMLSEYGSQEKGNSATLAYLEEHCELTAGPDAVSVLGSL